MSVFNLEKSNYDAAFLMLEQITKHLKQSFFAAEIVCEYMMDSKKQFGMEYVTFVHIQGLLTQRNIEDPMAFKQADLFWNKLNLDILFKGQRSKHLILDKFARAILEEGLILRTVDELEKTSEEDFVVRHLQELKKEYLDIKAVLIHQTSQYALSSPKWLGIMNESIGNESIQSAAKVAIESGINAQILGRAAFNMEVQASLSRQRRALEISYRHVMNNP